MIAKIRKKKKHKKNHLFGQPDGFSLLTGTIFAVRLIELPFTLKHDREFVMFRFFPFIYKTVYGFVMCNL